MTTHKQLSVTVGGVSPLLMHNGRLSDPLDPFAKELKRVTSKKKKTDDDHAAMSRVEWYGGIYHEGDIEINNGAFKASPETRLIIPGLMLEAMLINGAKKNKNGPAFKAGVLCDGDFPLEYDGPKHIDELWQSNKFVHRTSVRVGPSRVMRTRAIFRKWKLAFTVSYAPDVVSESEVLEAVEISGAIVGLGDYRPRFGRFTIE